MSRRIVEMRTDRDEALHALRVQHPAIGVDDAETTIVLDALETEILGAFLLGYGLGGLIAQPDAVAASGPPGRFGPVGRFGGLSANLPVTLGIVGAAVAVLTRLDLSGLALRGSTPRNGLSMYVGWDARVI